MYEVTPGIASAFSLPFVMTPLLTLRRTLARTTHSIVPPIAQAVGEITAQQVQVTWHLSSATLPASATIYPVAFGGLRYGSVTFLVAQDTPPPRALHQEMQRLANECRDLMQFLDLIQWQRWQRAQPVARRQEQVTARERDILLHCFAGHSRTEIARRLSIAPTTVKKHVRNLYEKLGVHSMQEALASGRASGLFLHLL